MAESLFDHRYRYDFIYPRGRSGETLRAVDIDGQDRAVVIKRPAPGDAPPIRAVQEVSILNERRALKRLAGHPVLAALLGDGSFHVGGVVHQYIVMERVEGVTVADLAAELAANGERLPELEMLVIVDALLDVLRTAHARDIIYNDVDARHLFWNRDTYRLKMIDWGNAVFLEGDTVTPQGISRQTDVYQVGELLYFILTGGRRADVPRDASAAFALDFGDDDQRVHSQLQQIVSKALHPNPRYRYPGIQELRADLTRYKAPLDQQRNATVALVNDKLRQGSLSKAELRDLQTALEPALVQDPGYPTARQARLEIQNRLRDLSVGADLDAVRIYMNQGLWRKAADLLRELQSQAGPETVGRVGALLDISVLLSETELAPIPEPIVNAIGLLLEGHAQAAATLLLLDSTEDDAQRVLQWQIAERISAHLADVLLLRPNLYRVNTTLRQLAKEGHAAQEARSLLNESERLIEEIATTTLMDVNQLLTQYRLLVDHVSALNPLLQTFALQHQISASKLPFSALERALNAAMTLADNMHVISRQATASPRGALDALNSSRAIDPLNPIWDELERLLDRLYDRLDSAHRYAPMADGTDLQAWLHQTYDDLLPYSRVLADDALTKILDNLRTAGDAWNICLAAVLEGDRESVDTALRDAAEAVKSLSPALSQWLAQWTTSVTNAQFIERYAIPGGVGRALADGWIAWDRGRLAEAETLGQQALEGARSEAERTAATRLHTLSRITGEWVERGGVINLERTQGVLETIESLWRKEEKQLLDQFTAQMPSIETYLKAMSRGLVASYTRHSTAGLRLLFLHYLMRCSLDAYEGLTSDSTFWREAALKTLPEGEQHIVVRSINDYVARQRDLSAAQGILAQAQGKTALPNLTAIRRELESSPQAKALQPASRALQEVEASLKDWADGEFKAAGMKLETALKLLADLEQNAHFDLSGPRQWLMDLMSAAAELHIQGRDMRARIESRPDGPDDLVERVHRHQVDVTDSLLGEAYSGTLRQWRDTYRAFVEAYQTDERRTRRLDRFNELFRAMFIDRHPAYGLYRHWYTVIDRAAEYAAPATDDPTPRIESYIVADVEPYEGERYRMGRGLPRRLLVGGGIGAALLLVALLALVNRPQDIDPLIAVTISATPQTRPSSIAAAIVTDEPTQAPLKTEIAPTVVKTSLPLAAFATNTLIPAVVPSATLTSTDTPLPPSATPTNTPVPTATNTPTETPIPSPTLTPTITLTPTLTPLPPQGVQGEQDLLALLAEATNLPFNADLFAPSDKADEGWRMGTGSTSSGGILYIIPPAELLEKAYGNNAISRIRRVEANLVLRTFNPSVVTQNDVFFGVLLQSTRDGNNAGVRLQVVDTKAITLTRVLNNDVRFLNQRAVNTIIGRLRVERDVNTGDVSLYFNDIPLGESFPFLAADAPLLPVLFVKDGGVVVGVTSWTVTLR